MWLLSSSHFSVLIFVVVVEFTWQNISLLFFSFSFSPLLELLMQPKSIISTGIRASLKQVVGADKEPNADLANKLLVEESKLELDALNVQTNLKSVLVHAHIDAQKQLTRSLACSSVRNVASNVDVCLPGPMAINKSALVTITGRLKVEAPNVLEIFTFYP